MGATGHSFHEKGEAGAHESMTKTIDNNEDPVWDEEFTLAYDVVRSRQWWAGVVAVGTRRRVDSRLTSIPMNTVNPMSTCIRGSYVVLISNCLKLPPRGSRVTTLPSRLGSYLPEPRLYITLSTPCYSIVSPHTHPRLASPTHPPGRPRTAHRDIRPRRCGRARFPRRRLAESAGGDVR